MGIYLNGKRAYSLFQEDCAMTYYIDKTEMLDEIVRILEQKGKEDEIPLRDQAAAFWKDNGGEYGRGFSGKGSGQQ